MQRRLPAEGTVATRFILAFVILLLPWLVDAQQQQNRAQSLRQGFESPRDGSGTESISRLEATRLSERAIPIETPIVQRGTDVKKKHKRNSHDESAIATFDAPADSAVRAHPARRSGIVDSTGLSPQSARSLEDWEVEDFILLATVDGKLHARDRRTGKERWALELEQPMLETIYHKKNRSSLDENANPVDDYLWVVEPSRDGSLYVYVPSGSHPGLMNTGLTIKKLVEEMTPYADEKPAVVYTGEKKTTLITLDAETGTIIRWFGTKGSIVNKDSSCSRPDGIVDPEGDECSTKGTLTLGRTEYTVGIQAKDGHEIATIKYTEWGPNLFDQDLLRQHRNTLDGKYLYSSHDGSIFAYDFSQADRHSQLYKQKFSSPVVRVFDIARPWGTEHKTPDLIALPQPVPPIVDESLESIRNNRIFLNHTEDGSWYAMSGNSYPLVIDGPERAQCDNVDWWQQAPLWESMNEDQVSKVLVGLHSIDKHEPAHKHLLTIGGPAPIGSETEPDLNNSLSIASAPTMLQNFLNNFSSQLIILGLVVLVIISNTHRVNRLFMRNLSLAFGWKTSEIHSESESSTSLELSLENLSDRELSLPENTTADEVPKDDNTTVAEPISETKAESVSLQPPDVNIVSPVKADDDNTPEINEDPDATPKKKKKAHRGKRGGRMHNKNKGAKKDSDDSPPNGQNSSDNLDSNASLPRPPATVEDAIRDAQNLGNVPRTIEPDIVTVDNNVDDISDSIVRIDKMVFDQNKIVGTGSNGTTVFKGEWDGRTVAIKRLLIQFFDLASQETKLLRESDDHPNGMLFGLVFGAQMLIWRSYPLLCTNAACWVPLHCFGALSSFSCGSHLLAPSSSRVGPSRSKGSSQCSLPNYQWRSSSTCSKNCSSRLEASEYPREY
jgi:serine/threonine-protein kinase/endoribonuclease IRE1